MPLKRVIGSLCVRNCSAIQTIGFEKIFVVGDPQLLASYLEDRGIDEIVVTGVDTFSADRDFVDFANIIRRIAERVCIPIVATGGIKCLKRASLLFENGADRVALNTGFLDDHSLPESIAARYGAQSVILKIDYSDTGYVFDWRLGRDTSVLVSDLLNNLNVEFVSEFYLKSVFNDGKKHGLNLLSGLNPRRPIIYGGGVGSPRDVTCALSSTDVDGVVIGNYLLHEEIAVRKVKREMVKAGFRVRRS